MSSAIVTPVAQGSARHYDVELLPLWAASSGLDNASAACTRAGTPLNLLGTSSNWGLLGTDTGTLTRYGPGTQMYQVRGGAIGAAARFPWVVARQANITSWRTGLWVAEVILVWPTNATGADNGFLWGWRDVNNNRRSVNECWGVESDNAGNVRVFVRGPTGTDFTPVPGIVPTDLTKIRVELRNATRDVEASCQVYINDAAAPAFVQAGNAANFPATAAAPNCLISFAVGCGSDVNYVLLRDWGVWRGPNTVLGM